MEILINGVSVQEYQQSECRYIEALRGKEYSIRLYNPTAGRVAVSLSVDGLNSIDARHTTAGEASKWIIDPYQSVTISGWQTSNQTARRFYFTTENRSYARWIGDTRNVGIISAAFFREKPVIVPAATLYEQESRRRIEEGAAAGGKGADAKSCPAPAQDLAATGIGHETDHRVTRVDLDLEDSPAACLSIRYEYHPELVRLGILREFPSALERREQARGFDDDGFAPDPYRRDQ